MARTIITPVDIKSRQVLPLKVGATVKVWQKIQEKGKTRLQLFEGLVIAHKHGAEAGATFTVRKVASGVGVEKIFPLYSPNIDKIEVVRQAKVRRAKLYYVRDQAAKEQRRRMKQSIVDAIVTDEVISGEPVESVVAE
ncbi:MAG: 50S ribosomal protein L19 [Candidatus Vogelbacteria bacterium]|nr:50S ribosomal protein L19 [Candidatus Vogelbacteria bacterium]